MVQRLKLEKWTPGAGVQKRAQIAGDTMLVSMMMLRDCSQGPAHVSTLQCSGCVHTHMLSMRVSPSRPENNKYQISSTQDIEKSHKICGVTHPLTHGTHGHFHVCGEGVEKKQGEKSEKMNNVNNVKNVKNVKKVKKVKKVEKVEKVEKVKKVKNLSRNKLNKNCFQK